MGTRLLESVQGPGTLGLLWCRLSVCCIWGRPPILLSVTTLVTLVHLSVATWTSYEIFPLFRIAHLLPCFQAGGKATSILKRQVPKSVGLEAVQRACYRPLEGHLGSPVWMAFRAEFFSHWKRLFTWSSVCSLCTALATSTSSARLAGTAGRLVAPGKGGAE